jgi:hypothetical protein
MRREEGNKMEKRIDARVAKSTKERLDKRGLHREREAELG